MSAVTITLDDREHATILAALRWWQETDSALTIDHNDIATQGGEVDALSIAEIDALCARISAGGAA